MDGAVDSALAHGLGVVLSMHHADAVMTDRPEAFAVLCALWRQIAARYQHAPQLIYDLRNDPRDAMTPERWNRLLPDALRAVQDIDPHRTVIIGGAKMSTVPGLLALDPSRYDHLMITLLYYEPFAFTHQGASSAPSRQPASRTGQHGRAGSVARWSGSSCPGPMA